MGWSMGWYLRGQQTLFGITSQHAKCVLSGTITPLNCHRM